MASKKKPPSNSKVRSSGKRAPAKPTKKVQAKRVANKTPASSKAAAKPARTRTPLQTAAKQGQGKAVEPASSAQASEEINDLALRARRASLARLLRG